MARSEALARVEKMYIDGFPQAEDASVDELRACYDALLQQFPLPPEATTAERELGGVPTATVTAPGAATDKVLLWFHGGGYVLGSAKAFREMGYGLSKASGLTVVLPDYRLAPEHKFPAAVEDGVAVTSAAIAKYGAGNVFGGGDSAGGGLAVSTLVSLRDRGEALPSGAVLISPLLDCTASGETIDTNAATDIAVSRDSISGLGAAYLQGHDPKDPLASPLFAQLHGLPPVLVMVGSTEALLDDARRFDKALSAAGGTVKVSVYDDMCHVWTLFSSILPEGEAALDEAGRFLRQHAGL
ncbi:alpha/beta hydrolase [Streptomyces hirsutus]|uniref:alpha/beta hydrolase n=1 Tax=Streptomyces hirsutus TaxID=35620 RepID=UPI003421F570